MIGDFIYGVITIVINMIAGFFAGLSYIIPHQIPDAFNLLFSYARIGDSFFPMSDALLALLTILQVWILLYIIKIILFAFSALPWIGKVISLPQHGVTEGGSKSVTTTKNGVRTTTSTYKREQKKRF